MDSQSYLEWSKLSGLYLENESHVARYRTYQSLISAAGLTTVVVSEFLKDAAPALNVVNWRTHSVYEVAADAQGRVEMTAAALEAIGAERIAKAVRETKSNSPFEKLNELFASGETNFANVMQATMEGMKGIDLMSHMRESIMQATPGLGASVEIKTGEVAAKDKVKPTSSGSETKETGHESLEDIAALLERFVAAHRAELQADLDKHGDPRIQPGFTREARMQELDALRDRQLSIQAQRDDARNLDNLLKTMKRLATPTDTSKKVTPAKLEKHRRELRDLVKLNRARNVDDLIPEMVASLAKVDEFMASMPELFAPPKTADTATMARLEALGEFETDTSRSENTYKWDSPAGLQCDWTRFSLSFSVPRKHPEVLAACLDAIDRLKKRFASLSEEWRSQLLSNFRDVYFVQMPDWQLEYYEPNDEGEPTDAGILRNVNGGSLALECDGAGSVCWRAFFDVEWDEEHGYPIEWDDEPDTEPVASAATTDVVPMDLSKLKFSESGPPLTAADIAGFEAHWKTTLPAEYRQFLLAANGGRPVQSQYTIKFQGEKYDADVIRFLHISGATSEPYPAGSLEATIHACHAMGLPNDLFPLAESQIPGITQPVAGSVESPQMLIMFVRSGKKAGQLLVIDFASIARMFPVVTAAAMEVPSEFTLLGTDFQPREAGMPASMRAMYLRSLTESSMVAAKNLQEFVAKKLKKPVIVELPVWLKAIRDNNAAAFVAWLLPSGSLDASFQDRNIPRPMTVIDFLAKEASADFLMEIHAVQKLPSKQLRKSWETFGLRSFDRYRVLMSILPKETWKTILTTYEVWDHPDLLEQLAASGTDFNDSVNDEGATPIQLATQCGKPLAVKWLMQHGADPNKFDKYSRNAFTWTEHGPGYDCLATLQGKDESAEPSRPPQPDVPGIETLRTTAKSLAPGVSLVVSIQIKTPPVTEVEQRIYHECHYELEFDLNRESITIKDVTTPRQTYMSAKPWPALLFAPIVQWPQLTTLWDQLEVFEFDWNQVAKKRKYQPTPRPDLYPAANEALQQAFNAEEAEVRKIRVSK